MILSKIALPSGQCDFLYRNTAGCVGGYDRLDLPVVAEVSQIIYLLPRLCSQGETIQKRFVGGFIRCSLVKQESISPESVHLHDGAEISVLYISIVL